MRRLVYLAAGGLEQDRGANAPMDVPQRTGGVCIEGLFLNAMWRNDFLLDMIRYIRNHE